MILPVRLPFTWRVSTTEVLAHGDNVPGIMIVALDPLAVQSQSLRVSHVGIVSMILIASPGMVPWLVTVMMKSIILPELNGPAPERTLVRARSNCCHITCIDSLSLSSSSHPVLSSTLSTMISLFCVISQVLSLSVQPV